MPGTSRLGTSAACATFPNATCLGSWAAWQSEWTCCQCCVVRAGHWAKETGEAREAGSIGSCGVPARRLFPRQGSRDERAEPILVDGAACVGEVWARCGLLSLRASLGAAKVWGLASLANRTVASGPHNVKADPRGMLGSGAKWETGPKEPTGCRTTEKYPTIDAANGIAPD